MIKKAGVQSEYPRKPGGPGVDIPQAIADDVEADHEARLARAAKRNPEMDRFVWSIMWKVVAAIALAAGGWFVIYQTRHLIGLLVVSTFFALAMIPGVNALVRRWDIRRGAAVGIIYLIAVVVLGVIIGLLIPGVVHFAEAVSANVSTWVGDFNSWTENTFGTPAFESSDATSESINSMMYAVSQWGDNVLGFISSGVGLVFDLFTIAAFSFYIAAGFPKIVRALMSRMPPERQQVFWWITDQSIEQTGGYFYSRLLLMVVNGGIGFFVMAVLGLPVVYALPLAVFMGFVSEFIPMIGTYIGAFIPIIVLLAVQGPGAAIIMTIYIIIYQQAENYWLSPRFSSQTMELNGAVAFGAAIAGGAIAGVMGAFMALPIAALITAIIKNTGRTYEVVEARAGESHVTDGARSPDDEDADVDDSWVTSTTASMRNFFNRSKSDG